MTPKEKAKELFKKYSVYNLDNGEQWYIANNFAKQCALITVNEIIKALRKDLPEIGLGKGYWYTVKKEIEDL